MVSVDEHGVLVEPEVGHGLPEDAQFARGISEGLLTKDGPDWQHLKPAILGAIMEHFMSGAPVMVKAGPAAETSQTGEFYDKADEELVITIKELLDTRVRPAVAQDGGDITFRGFENGTVFLHMKGACAGCPSSTATLKHGIQNLLRHFVPEVQQVEQVS